MKTTKDNPYKDIMHLPRHVSKSRPQMKIKDRAAQFAPFSAVVGHNTAIKETERLTERKRDLDETEKTIINEALQWIEYHLDHKEEVQIEYFKKDLLKEGGAYITYVGYVKKFNHYENTIEFIDGKIIAIVDILKVHIKNQTW